MRGVPIVAAALMLAACSSAGPSAGPSVSGPPASPTDGAARAVGFPASDGAPLSGRWYGGSTMVVVLSNMGDNDPTAWDSFASDLAGPDVGVLTYTYRYPVRSPGFTTTDAENAVRDLEGAIAYARGQGATRLALVGASLGGMVVAKTAASARADAVVIMSAPNRRPEFDLRVTDGEVATIAAPKLFIVSDDDSNVPPEQTRPLFDAAREPKTWQSFPGAAHGTQLLGGPHGDDVHHLVASFVTPKCCVVQLASSLK